LRVVPHLWAGAPAFFAGVHVCAAVPAGFLLEYPMGDRPMLQELIDAPVPGGRWSHRDSGGPGLGFTINEDVLRSYTVVDA